MSKKSNNTKTPSRPPKQWNRLIGYSWKSSEPHPDAIKDLCNRLRLWAVRDDALRMDDFFDEENVPSSSFYVWKDKYEDLKEGYEFALRRLASRRYKLAFFKEADGNIFKLDQHLYDVAWRLAMEFHAQLKKQEEQQPTKVIVEVTPYPSVNEVPEKNASRNKNKTE